MNNKDSPIIYFDMDGCLAKWQCVPVEETKKPNYYAKLKPQEELIAAVLKLQQEGFNTKILSCAYQNGYAEREKRKWLMDYGLGSIPAIIVPYGESKADYVPGSEAAILIDDYSPNLFAWVASGQKAIKFRNEVNGSHGTWTGPFITCFMDADAMVKTIKNEI